MDAATVYLCQTCGRRADDVGSCAVDGAELAAMADDPLLGLDIGGYRVVSRIGVGGMGTVYKAVMPSIGSQVAIKVLSGAFASEPEMSERFISEAKIANLIRHDGLVNVIALGVLDDGRPYQIMEYLHGASLSDVIRQRGRVPAGTACKLIAEALRALSPVHARGIVHRDLKPSNLYVTIAGRAKVIDFGIAKLTAEPGLTHTGQAIGTPQYMAPEQIEGNKLDGRSDVYAMGIVLFEALSGTSPFPGRVIEALATQERLPRLHQRGLEVPDAVDDVLAKATAHRPEQRFATADDMADALDAIVQDLPRSLFGAPLAGVDMRASAAVLPAVHPSEQGSRGTATVVERPKSDRAQAEPASPAPPTVPLARASSDSIVPGTLGRYEVRGVLGEGGAGIVLDGFDPQIGRRVALKVLSGESTREALRAEAQAMARVVHANVLTVFDLGEHDGKLFLAMEHVEGTDLARWLATTRRPWREIVDMFVAAGHGLGATHAVGVVHRDFKPANVVIGADSRPRVSDFGIAGGFGETSAAAGTAAYMAPEQLEGGLAVPASDQFAFCAALWEALHGERPFAGEGAPAIALAARRGERRPSTRGDLPPGLIGALARGLAAMPGQRFASMNELLTAITQVTTKPVIQHPRARRVILIGAVGVALAATALVVQRRFAARDTYAPPSPLPIALDASLPVTGTTPDAALTAVADAGRRPDDTGSGASHALRPGGRVRACDCVLPSDLAILGRPAPSQICQASARTVPMCSCTTAEGYAIYASATCEGRPIAAGDTCSNLKGESHKGARLRPGDTCSGLRLAGEDVVESTGTFTYGSCDYCASFVWKTKLPTGSPCTGIDRSAGTSRSGVLRCDAP